MTHDLHWLQQGTQQGPLTGPFTHCMHCLATQRPHWLETTYHHKGLKQVVIGVSGFHVLRTVLLFSAVFGVRSKQLSKLSQKNAILFILSFAKKKKQKKNFFAECCGKTLKNCSKQFGCSHIFTFLNPFKGQ